LKKSLSNNTAFDTLYPIIAARLSKEGGHRCLGKDDFDFELFLFDLIPAVDNSGDFKKA
jgi:hypothetical protein